MAVYRKKLVDKDGNTIIPAIGDIYGPVYTASLQSASGGIATYTFTPDTPVEANRVYAVKFPVPTVNNAVILLGDGNMTASSILLPPVAASDNPSYEIAYTTNINDTEVWLLMYNGSGQWICLNQKKSVSNGDIDWTTIPQGMSGYAQTNYKGYFDIGNIRIQFMNLYKTGLNTAQYGYNVWWEDWPAPFGNNYYVAIANQTSDTGNVAGNDLKVVGRENGRVQINYNHVTAIGSGNLYWGVIGIGLKPS